MKAAVYRYQRRDFNQILAIDELANIVAVSVLLQDSTGRYLIVHRGNKVAISSGNFATSCAGSVSELNKMKHEFLYLVWKHPESGKSYTVGKLIRENGYQSDKLFLLFSSRLPDPKRKDIKEILDKYGLDEYDGYELLKRSGGRLPIDTYELIPQLS